jgi:K+-sensing histidine kinase KdpD
MKITDIQEPDQVVLPTEAMEKSMHNVIGQDMGVFKHRKKSGEVIQVEIKDTNLVYNNEKARLILANDITERMQYIEAIERQNLTLRDIAWTQSHVVRAPVARILGLVEILKEYNRQHLNEETLKLLSLMKESVAELDVVIKEIVDKTINNEDMNNELLKGKL